MQLQSLFDIFSDINQRIKYIQSNALIDPPTDNVDSNDLNTHNSNRFGTDLSDLVYL